MPVDLSKPAGQVDFTTAAYQPMLERLQANIVKSHGRDESRQVFLKFTGPAPKVRQWIREKIAPRVLSARLQLEQLQQNINGGLGRTKFDFESAVTLKGGEYFFAPSRPFLAAL